MSVDQSGGPVGAKKRTRKSKPPYSGFALRFEPERTEFLASKLPLENEISESFSALDNRFERREIVFLVLSANPLAITSAVLMQRMHGGGGSGKLRMRLNKPVEFSPITSSELANSIDLGSIVSTPETANRIAPEDWTKLLETVKTLRPASAKGIEALVSAREEERRLFGDSRRILRLIEQRDALGIVLELAELDRPRILASINADQADSANSILEMLEDEQTSEGTGQTVTVLDNIIPVQERSLIENDKRVFKGLLEDEMKARVFQEKKRSVRVYVTDKTDLETVMGIDLLIYLQCFESFLFIQYKAMEKTEKLINGIKEKTWSYTVDPKLTDQLIAMASVRKLITTQTSRIKAGGNVWDYRLNEEPFYVKFCERTRESSRDDSLVPGMMICAIHLEDFLTQPDAKGDKGGIHVGYHNCRRYLSNTQFLELAQEGWIGCKSIAANLLVQFINTNKKDRVTMLVSVDIPRAKSARGRAARKNTA